MSEEVCYDQGLPEDFVQLLRVTGMVRPTASKLGCTDRLRINAGYAYQVCRSMLSLSCTRSFDPYFHNL